MEGEIGAAAYECIPTGFPKSSSQPHPIWALFALPEVSTLISLSPTLHCIDLSLLHSSLLLSGSGSSFSTVWSQSGFQGVEMLSVQDQPQFSRVPSSIHPRLTETDSQPSVFTFQSKLSLPSEIFFYSSNFRFSRYNHACCEMFNLSSFNLTCKLCRKPT